MHREHLSFEQIEKLSEQEGPRPVGADSDGDWSHIGICVECSNLLERCKEVNAKLDKLGSINGRGFGQTNMKCPDERVWFDVVGGTIVPEDGMRYIQHASTCDECGQRLKAATRIFGDNLSPEEENLLNVVSQTQHEFPASISRHAGIQSQASSSQKRSPATSIWQRGAYAITAIAAVALFAIFVKQQDSTSAARHLLAQTYTENRMVEMRIPSAAYADIQQQRSGENRSLAVSSSTFRRAIDQITAGIEKHPTDPRWRILDAQSALIDWRYQDAFAALSKISAAAIADKAVKHDMMLTRALALYEQGEFEDRKLSLGDGENLLADLLNEDPDNAVALFNRAIVCEKLLMNECAIDDWRRFLKVEKDQRWLHEARLHLKNIEEKKTPVR